MAPLWRLVMVFVISMNAVTFALPNHTPDAPGVLHRRLPDHTPSAPAVLHARKPSDVPAYGQLVRRQASTITGAAPTATGAAPSATPAMQIEQLVAGIGFNIMAQRAQIAVVSIMQNLGNAPAVPDAKNMLYKVAKVTSTALLFWSLLISGRMIFSVSWVLVCGSEGIICNYRVSTHKSLVVLLRSACSHRTL